jgi:enoyl-[acyl-carrier protein] reductase I
VAGDLRERWGELDGIVHAIAFAPEDALGGNFLTAEWPSVAMALQTSAYSLKALAAGLADLMKPGSSVVGLDFDARVAWPAYDWMGVAKAALESTSRYLARDLGERGIRVNLVSAGPVRTLAAKGISGFEEIEGEWGRQAPLGWDTGDPEPVGRAVVSLLSDWWPATTGELIHVDGGYHAMGAPIK